MPYKYRARTRRREAGERSAFVSIWLALQHQPAWGKMAVVSTLRPSFFDPCLPVLGRAPPKGPDWVHQLKMDGYRCLVGKVGQRVRLYSRNGTEWSDRLPGVAEAFAAVRT